MKQFDLFSVSAGNEASGEKLTTEIEKDRSQIATGGPKRRTLLPDITSFFDGELLYVSDFIAPDVASQLFEKLRNDLHWQSEQVKVYGKWHTIPRMQAWYGGEQATYSYSGKTMQPLPLTAELDSLRQACSRVANVTFNSVLTNLYRNGEDCMGNHSDDEPELGDRPCIASVTLGATRRFDLLHKRRPYKLQLYPESGSLLLMKGDTQTHWQHGIARTKRPVGERINLTFRRIIY